MRLQRLGLLLLLLLGTWTARGFDLTVVSTNLTLPEGTTLQVPLTASEPATFKVDSISWRAVQGTLTPTSNRSLVLHVSGVDVNTNAFAGDLVLQLFEDLVPVTTARIVDLVNSNFYAGRLFHRVIEDFMCQAGGTNGSSGTTLDDEFEPTLTFNGFGQLAMANAGNDSNDEQFFITDVDLSVGNPAKLPPRHLNFEHTIFGQLTRGFELVQSILTTPTGTVTATNITDQITTNLTTLIITNIIDTTITNITETIATNTTLIVITNTVTYGDFPLTPVTINSASITNDTSAAILRLTSLVGFVGPITVNVSAMNNQRQIDRRTLHLNVVPNTVNDPPFLGSTPTQLIVTQSTAASFILTATDVNDDDIDLRLIDDETHTFPAHLQAELDDVTGRLWLLPDVTATGVVQLTLEVRDTPHYFNPFPDAERFTLTVLPKPPTNTFTILPKSGSLLVSPDILGSRARVSGTLLFTNGSDRAFGSNDYILLTVGNPGNPVRMTIRPNDTGRTTKGGTLRFRSIPGAQPTLAATFDSAKGTFKIALSNFNFPVAPSNQVILAFTVGNDHGSNVTAWTQSKPGTFVYPK